MTSSERGDNNVEHIAINSYIVCHSEYDIEVNDNDDIALITLIKDARKLFIDPTYVVNAIEFTKNNNTLLPGHSCKRY